MNNLKPKRKILQSALQKIVEFQREYPKFEEDFETWYELGKNDKWDLNIGYYDGKFYADLYPVIDDETNTQEWVELIKI